MVPHWQEQNIAKYMYYEKLIALSPDKRLETEETQEKKTVSSTVNFPAKVMDIRHTDDDNVLEDSLQKAF